MIPAVDDIITAAIERRIFPGAVVLVLQDGLPRHARAYGTTMYADPGSQPVTLATIYDIASLTKVFTATAALRLLDQGLLALDAPVVDYLPGARATGVTVRHLLTHSSGLHLQLSTLRQRGAAGIRAAVYSVEPSRPPGTHVAYTNINSLLLGDIVAQVYGRSLDIALHELVIEPLGMQYTRFCPPVAWRARIAPTEWDCDWRGGLVWGEVHDESAHALGGVAGHAGLFSTVADLQRFAQMWLAAGVWRDSRLLRAETVALAIHDHTAEMGIRLTEPGTAALHCGLGWMLKRANFMGNAPDDTYGHTGFTGPVITLVPRYRLAVILLSNRTYPHRTPPDHHAVTAAVVTAVLEHLLIE